MKAVTYDFAKYHFEEVIDMAEIQDDGVIKKIYFQPADLGMAYPLTLSAKSFTLITIKEVTDEKDENLMGFNGYAVGLLVPGAERCRGRRIILEHRVNHR